MKALLVALALVFPAAVHALETKIRIVGAYVSGQSLNRDRMTTHLQRIKETWDNSGLPTAAGTTIELLSRQAIPVTWSGTLGSMDNSSKVAWEQESIKDLRDAWDADVVILFRQRPDKDPACGATSRRWSESYWWQPAPDTGLDLHSQNWWYIGVVDPSCVTLAAAHEFGHVLGGGHATDNNDAKRLFSDARAHVYVSGQVCLPQCKTAYSGTALSDFGDVPGPLTHLPQYSRPAAGYGDATHNNVRTLKMTARSVANYYPYSAETTVLRAPIGVFGTSLGCGWYKITWQNDPATNVPVDHYDVWYAQPVTNPFVYGWTVFGPYTDALVSGQTARAKVTACSGFACTGMSVSYFDAWPQYCGPIEP